MQYKNITKKLTGRILLTFALALALASLSGCGKNASEATSPSAEPIPAPSSSVENTENDSTPAPQDDAQEAASDNRQDSNASSAPPNNYAPQSDTELSGSIRTIDTDSFVVSQSFDLPIEEGDVGAVTVMPAEGSADEVLITVHVSETTSYKIHTVKNGGVNGDADVEKTDGSFSDLQEKTSVNAQGYYQDGDFWADEIIIYRYA